MPRPTAPHTRESQEELRTFILENPEEGWKAFLRDYGPLIKNLIRNFKLSPEDQEEVLQEVAHTLIRNNHKAIRDWQFERSSLANYIAVITVRAAVTFTKSAFHQFSRRIHPIGEGTEDAADPLDPFMEPTRSARERLHRIHLTQKFEEALCSLVEQKTLRPEDYQMLVLRMRGLSYREIESLLGISVETLTSRFSRLKPVLRTALATIEPALGDVSRE